MKKVFMLLSIGLLLYLGQSRLPGNVTGGQVNFAYAKDVSGAEDNLQFTVDGGKIYFFEPRKKMIFVYQVTTNRFNRVIALDELGEDLKQSRTLSGIEEGTIGGY